jgi:hypothetical protein
VLAEADFFGVDELLNIVKAAAWENSQPPVWMDPKRASCGGGLECLLPRKTQAILTVSARKDLSQSRNDCLLPRIRL